MNEKKRAALTVAAVNDGNGQILLRGFKPKKDIITDFEPAQGTIASILNHGKENAITCREIANITGLPFRRVRSLWFPWESTVFVPWFSDY